MNVWHQWLEIHASGRREVLRRVVPELLCKHVNIQKFYFHWNGDQPSLRLYLSLKDNHKQILNQVINTIENTLDTIMTLYPWEEQPLLDWGGKPMPRRLSVMLKTELDFHDIPYMLPFDVTQQIYRLLEHNGTAIKSTWIHTTHLAFNLYPALCADHQVLLDRIHTSIRERIPTKLAWLERNTTLAHEKPPLWNTICDAMHHMDMTGRGHLLQNIANCLGFRPDEQAYLMLVASTIKQEAKGGSR